ncbi:hypothetical protein [Actinacidiphila sp. bgisy145]
MLVSVFRVAAALDCRVLDCSEGDLITQEGTSGWRAFQEFRDRVVDLTS